MDNVDARDDASKHYETAQFDRAEVGARTLVVLSWNVSEEEAPRARALTGELAARALDGGARVAECSQIRVSSEPVRYALKLSCQYDRDPRIGRVVVIAEHA